MKTATADNSQLYQFVHNVKGPPLTIIFIMIVLLLQKQEPTVKEIQTFTSWKPETIRKYTDHLYSLGIINKTVTRIGVKEVFVFTEDFLLNLPDIWSGMLKLSINDSNNNNINMFNLLNLKDLTTKRSGLDELSTTDHELSPEPVYNQEIPEDLRSYLVEVGIYPSIMDEISFALDYEILNAKRYFVHMRDDVGLAIVRIRAGHEPNIPKGCSCQICQDYKWSRMNDQNIPQS